MKNIIIAAIIIPYLSFSQGVSTRYAELKLPETAQVAALASSPLTTPSLEVSIQNPAVLANVQSSEILLSHISWVQDVQNDLLAASIPFSFVTIGLYTNTIGVGGLEIRDIAGPLQGTFTTRTSIFQLSFAKSIQEKIAVGISFKYLYQKYYIDESDGYAGDLGIVYREQDWQCGITVNNIGSLSAMRQENGDLPSTIQLGGSYQIPLSVFDNSIFLSYSTNLIIDEKHIRLGIQSVYDKTFSMTIGYQTGYEDRNISAGFGVVYSFLRFDYAYLPFSLGFGDAHLFTLTFNIL